MRARADCLYSDWLDRFTVRRDRMIRAQRELNGEPMTRALEYVFWRVPSILYNSVGSYPLCPSYGYIRWAEIADIADMFL